MMAAARAWRRAAPAALGALLALGVLAHARGDDSNPADAVFQLMDIDATDQWTPKMTGTAFFVRPDGTAITNSHVVFPSLSQPRRYRLLAIVRHTFYGVRVICATRLSYDPIAYNGQPVPIGRDVAEVALEPPSFPFRAFAYRVPGGPEVTLGTAHDGPMPAFSPLIVADGPATGEHVEVLGFGQISPIPEEWRAEGQISAFHLARDGTEVFDMQFQGRPQPGNSGSPVLNDRGHVIGIWTWHSTTDSSVGSAQSNDVLRPPCR
jgi:hypothetical protein